MKIFVSSSDKAVRFAAAELEKYLTLMGAPDLCFSLKVENPAHEGMTLVENAELDDQYYIRVDSRGQVIVGNNPRALLLSVYRYLTLIGCRFLRPGKRFEIIPTLNATSDFYAFEEHTASLRHRGVCIEGTDSVENVSDMLDWLPKIGCNSFFFQFKTPHNFLKKWYEHDSEFIGEWSEQDSENALEKFDEAMEIRGLLRHRMGHGWTADIIGAKNTYGWDKDSFELSEKIRPIVAEVNGKRELIKSVAINTNLCYTNQKALKIFSESVIKYLLKKPDTEYLHIWLADGYHNFCECKACKNLRPADQYIVLLNFLDKELTRKGINVKLCLLMYEDLFWPPTVKRLDNPERFTLMFAPIHRTFNASYSEVKELPRIPDFTLNKTDFPEDVASNLAFLHAWRQVIPCDSFAYDYYLGRAHHGEPTHFKIAKILYDDLHHYKVMGLGGIISCQELRAAFPNALPNYVMGQASLNLSRDFDDIAREYYISAYGAYGEELYTEMSKLSILFDLDYANPLCPTPCENSALALNMEKAVSYIENIKELINKDKRDINAIQAYMWGEIDFFVGYTVLLAKIIRLCALGEKAASKEIFENEFIPLITKHESLDQAALDVARVINTLFRGLGLNKL